MKALTLKNEWYQFTINDVPTRLTNTEFVLLNKANSPCLQLGNIRRGDPYTGLTEGDLILHEGDEWLVSYERGFYAINRNYINKPLYSIKNYDLIGDCYTKEFPLSILKRSKHLFKYKSTIFRMEDIIGIDSKGGLILRCLNHPIDVCAIGQEAGIVVDGTRKYFGEKTKEGTIRLYKGRIAYEKNNKFTDAVTGGLL